MKKSKITNGKSKAQSGFTLLEMLIVISIISILLALLYGALDRARKFSKRAMAYTEIKNIETAFKQYYAHYNLWPSNTLANIKSQLTSGEDNGFIIDNAMARVLQGVRAENAPLMDELNPACIPFLEFARYSRITMNPVNPFRSLNESTDDTSRSYRVLFDSNGDRQITVPSNDPDVADLQSADPIIASVVVWTIIPANRTTDTQGNQQVLTDVILGSWDSFAVK